MVLAKKLVTGMRDVTPAEMQTREYVMSQIKETYKSSGFTQIETPYVEHTGNLASKQGGDNEKLTLRMLKRGDKLNLERSEEENDLVNSGPRYDLTLPLSRYYANNVVNPPSPFKVLQMGSVRRMDRPQKGRFRQSVQCDIDILGDATNLAEIELIPATTTVLGRICSDNGLTVRIDDRGISHGVALYCGLAGEFVDQMFVTLDEMDKIGYENVERESLGSGYSSENVSKYLDTLKNMTEDPAGVRALGQMLLEVVPTDVSEGLVRIMDIVMEVTGADFGPEFDPTLIRGVLYYVGTIFEVLVEGFGGPTVGGGRHDRMTGKFTGMEIPACGPSIGSERTVTAPMDDGFTVPGISDGKAFLFEKGINNARLTAVIHEVMEERKKGVQVLVAQTSRNKKFQKERLGREGYTEFKEFYKENLKN